MSLEDFQNILDQTASELGFSHWGAQTLERPLSYAHYRAWLEQKHHGEMSYLETHAPLKEDPSQLSQKVRSALVFAFPYFEHTPGRDEFPLKKNRIAAYARGFDYHFWLKQKLTVIIEKLKMICPNEEFLPVSDSFPLLERDLAARAGLGWFGKNTCLIHPKKGSLFILGEILTSLEMKVATEMLPDFCGTCTRCLDICPTQAIESPRRLNATKCISYWTIESRAVAPPELREKFGDWLFGCDLCQVVCPWNQKIFKNKLELKPRLETKLWIEHSKSDEQELENELRFLLTASGKQIGRYVLGTPLARAGSFGLRRNSLVVIANRRMGSLRDLVEKYIDDPKLGELARWTLEKLDVGKS